MPAIATVVASFGDCEFRLTLRALRAGLVLRANTFNKNLFLQFHLHPMISSSSCSARLANCPLPNSAQRITHVKTLMVARRRKRSHCRRLRIVLSVVRSVHCQFRAEHKLALPFEAGAEAAISTSDYNKNLFKTNRPALGP